MSELIESIERRQSRKEMPRLRMGDRVRVHFQVVEGTRRRTQVFEGVVLKLQGAGLRRTFTVRKISFGVGVERTFPLHSPKVERVELMARGEVRRAKLYYLRGRVGRRARIRERRDLAPEDLAMGAQTADGDAAAAEVSADGAAGEQEAEPGPAVEETAGQDAVPEAEAEVAADEAPVDEAAAPEEAVAAGEEATGDEEPQPPTDEQGAEPDLQVEGEQEPAADEQEPAQTGEKS